MDKVPIFHCPLPYKQCVHSYLGTHSIRMGEGAETCNRTPVVLDSMRRSLLYISWLIGVLRFWRCPVISTRVKTPSITPASARGSWTLPLNMTQKPCHTQGSAGTELPPKFVSPCVLIMSSHIIFLETQFQGRQKLPGFLPGVSGVRNAVSQKLMATFLAKVRK